MYTKRIIPCLDVKDGHVVKGTNFVGLRDAGDPVELASVYDSERADELVLLDITASNEERNTMVQVVSSCASQVFIPFIKVGGGIRTVEDMRNMPQSRSGQDLFEYRSDQKSGTYPFRGGEIRPAVHRFGRGCQTKRRKQLGGLYQWRQNADGLDYRTG